MLLLGIMVLNPIYNTYLRESPFKYYISNSFFEGGYLMPCLYLFPYSFGRDTQPSLFVYFYSAQFQLTSPVENWVSLILDYYHPYPPPTRVSSELACYLVSAWGDRVCKRLMLDLRAARLMTRGGQPAGELGRGSSPHRWYRLNLAGNNIFSHYKTR